MQELEEIDFLLADSELEAFYEKRQKRYFFDKDRYPFYFEKEQMIIPSTVCLPKKNSSTEYIRRRLNDVISEDIRVRNLDASKNPYVMEILTYHFPDDPMVALTIRAFDLAFGDQRIFKGENSSNNSSKAKNDLKYALSFFHSSSILAELNAAIFTDIPGCQKYDLLALEPGYSYQIFEQILNPLIDSVKVHDAENYEKQLLEIVRFRNSPYFDEFCNRIYSLSFKIFIHDRGDGERDRNYAIWLRTVCRKLKDIGDKMRGSPFQWQLSSNTALLYLEQFEKHLKTDYFRERTSEIMENRRLSTVVILTVNDTEHQAALAALDNLGIRYTPVTYKQNVYYQACTSNCTFYILKSMAGSVGAGGAALTVHDAISDLHPTAIIAGGVAFGCKKGSQKIGDILISKQVWQYDPQKQTATEIIRRGDKVTASPMLLSRFSTAITLWERENPGIDIHTGLIASGEVLSNNPAFIQELKDSEPEIIGGEMEGAGILSASERENCNWIVVKAICDWGAKKSDNFQPKAAENSFKFIFDVLMQFPLD